MDHSTMNEINDKSKERWINIHTWSYHESVDELINNIYKTYIGKRNSKTKMRMLKVIILELFLMWHHNHDHKLIISRNNNSYKKSRYNGLQITRTIIEVMDHLKEAGLIYHKNGFRDHFNQVPSKTSRIWPAVKLISIFNEVEFGPSDILLHENEETIIQNRPHPKKPKKKERVDYKDTRLTLGMRFRLKQYNQLLEQTLIEVPSLKAANIDPGSDTFVHRVFNHESFEKGGRFCGGWWQDCSKAIRPQITIDHMPTVEIDFSGLLPSILYAEVGIDYWSDIGGDPYDLSSSRDLPVSLDRKSTKRLFFMAVNSDSETKAFSAFNEKRGDSLKETRMKRREFNAILAEIKTRHKPIADLFGCGFGLDVMNRESQIAEKVITHFTRQRIPVLCIHDSFIAPVCHRDELMNVMQSAFAAVTGVEGVCLHIEGENEPTSLSQPVVRPCQLEEYGRRIQ